MGSGRCRMSRRRLEATAYIRMDHIVQETWAGGDLGRGRLGPGGDVRHGETWARGDMGQGETWARGRRGPGGNVVGVGGPCAKMMETEEDLGHLKGIQRYCEKKGPTESNTTVQESTKRPEA